jgi:hypothetical protein
MHKVSGTRVYILECNRVKKSEYRRCANWVPPELKRLQLCFYANHEAVNSLLMNLSESKNPQVGSQRFL